MSDQKDLTLEEAFEEMDELIGKMEDQDLPLEESFALYKKGVSLVDYCNQKIEKIECDIRKIQE